ncbi:minor histocompatibility antigen H13 [Cimex lectularius]|uniref:Signal peptide peptidase n=1 Tax=Cimex lectularius TaxID=79782 RepID=A0A8I6RY68_CIMLE|nr:minor histocompatibility antigen H13 [Cimex lectularius]
MAELLQKIFKENVSENATEAVKRIPATKEGVTVAYTSLVVMALLPVFFGSIRSVKYHKEQKQHHKETGGKPDTMTEKDAAMFPFLASAALFGLYIFFEIFSKEYINILLTAYFFVLGVMSLCHLSSSVVTSLVPSAVPNIPFHMKFTRGKGNHTKVLINYEFTTYDIVCLVICSLVGAWYIVKKHWIVNNLFGIAFAINGVELLHLNNVVTGCILLSGLFVYDVFWVFGTNVMVTVARSFEAPIKLVFPQDILEKGLTADNFAMLGLGDIVIPGIFIALLLRFDNSLNRNTKTYFYSTLTAYFLGLVATILVMHVFSHPQPALLYLVPACLGTPILIALVRGDINALFQYEDHPSKDSTESKKTSSSGSSNQHGKVSPKSKKNK